MNRSAFIAASRELAEELGQLPRREGDHWLVPSASAPLWSYTVIVGPGGFACTCASYEYRRVCKHITKVKEMIMTNDPESRALVPVEVKPPGTILPGAEELQTMLQISEELVKAKGLIPTALDTPGKVFAVILAGRAYGLDPMTAFRHIFVAGGRTSPSAQVMAGIIMAREGSARFIEEFNDGDSCTMRFLRPSRGLDQRYTYTMAMARKANLIKRDGAWETFPADLLRAKAVARLARIYAPDLINNLGPEMDYAPPSYDEETVTNDGPERMEGTPPEDVARDYIPRAAPITLARPKPGDDKGFLPPAEIDALEAGLREARDRIEADEVHWRIFAPPTLSGTGTFRVQTPTQDEVDAAVEKATSHREPHPFLPNDRDNMCSICGLAVDNFRHRVDAGPTASEVIARFLKRQKLITASVQAERIAKLRTAFGLTGPNISEAIRAMSPQRLGDVMAWLDQDDEA